jgi:hypothetical protein
MRKLFSLIILFTFCIIPQFLSQTQANTDTTYIRVITQRTDKIVLTLGITDTAKYLRVRTIITNQYNNLNTIQYAKNMAKKQIKNDTLKSKIEKDSLIKLIEDDINAKLKVLHNDYLANLAKELTPEQIIMVKDGMTFNVLSRTYQGYCDMLLNLTVDQKRQIMDWLVEARELAMDAESSEKKHATFGKYKGRINNYLSKAGYDLKKEGEEWQKRIKAKESEQK